MTTPSEITELHTEMNAKFERVYDDVAELKSEFHGMAKDVAGLKTDVAAIKQRLDLEFGDVHQNMSKLNEKLDRLLEMHLTPHD